MRIKYEQFMNEGSLIVLEGTILDMMQVYEDLDNHIVQCGYDVRCFGYDPYNAKEFVERWAAENGPFGIEKVIQGAKTESVPLGELKKLAEDRMLIFDEELMTYILGAIVPPEWVFFGEQLPLPCTSRFRPLAARSGFETDSGSFHVQKCSAQTKAEQF